jgi:trimeric autotransporter adhesin
MYRMALQMTVVAGLAGCASFLGVNDVTVERRIGGQVRGLWDGADGVALWLHARDADALLTVPANGAFHFAERLPPGTSYTVTVATNPVQHTCVVDGGGNGTVADDDVTSVSVACTGPAISIALSGPWGWTFDPTQETQTFEGSIATQSVVLTVSGNELSSASVNGTAALLGQPTPALALPLGKTMVPLAVTSRSGLSTTYQLVFDRRSSVLEQVAYGKASNAGLGNAFGVSVALSGDTLAVSASGEASKAVGVNPPGQADNSANGAGAVYVFVRTGATWTQQAYLKASNTEAGGNFGSSVALSGDTLAVGAIGEASGAVGVNPPSGQADHSARFAGAAYVFVRAGTTWTQQAYLKASNTGAGDHFGYSVALSGDTLAIGAYGEASGAVGVNIPGGQDDNSAFHAGAVYVLVRIGTTWAQQAYLKASNTDAIDFFGYSVALSGDTLAVGAWAEASAAMGVNAPGGQADNTGRDAGAAYVFVRSGATWTQQAYLKASNAESGDSFGYSVALSGDALAVGAYLEDSGAIGVNPLGGQADNSASGAGAVYVFR